jgi:uncharacterized protein (TIGR03437 family)
VITLKTPRFVLFALLITATTHPALAADTIAWDSSGNGLLSGTYNFREVMWGNNGDVHRVAIYGTIAFNANGGYTLNSSVIDSQNPGSVQPFSIPNGAYRISASGMGYMDDPIRQSAGNPSSTVWGLVSQGIFIGSSTDDRINSLFIAAKAPLTAPTNASFSGSYWAAAVNIPNGNVSQTRDMLFPLNPNGQGSLGTVNLTGFVGASGTNVAQTVNGAAYSFASGALTLSFGGSLVTQPLIAGDALCYLSADGNFFFGGSATGWDMIVGVRAYAGSVPPDALKGMYYQAGADLIPSSGFTTLATYYGAFSAVFDSNQGTITDIGHQRVLTGFDPSFNYTPFDYTYSDSFTLAADGSHDDFLGLHNVVGAGGAIRIGYGNTDRLGINISLRVPDFSGPGVYLDPTGIANAASSAPFTVGVSRGGFVALYGTNLASTTLVDGSMPFTLGGVQVLINGRQAPIYYVRSDVVSAIVPFATTGTVASIQVINNGVASDIRTVRVKDGTPGIYTWAGTGIGYAIAAHAQPYAAITPQNPARPGEAILVYLTGLGDVDPPVPDGVPPPLSPYSYAKIQPVVVIHRESVDPLFAGLAPLLTGVYAITFTVPADIGPGDVDLYVDIALPDSRTSEAQIPVGTGNLASQSLGDGVLRETLKKVRPREQPMGRTPGTLRRVPTR